MKTLLAVLLSLAAFSAQATYETAYFAELGKDGGIVISTTPCVRPGNVFADGFNAFVLKGASFSEGCFIFDHGNVVFKMDNGYRGAVPVNKFSRMKDAAN